MPAQYKVGDAIGPGTVVSDEYQEDVLNNKTTEKVVTSFGLVQTIYGRIEPVVAPEPEVKPEVVAPIDVIMTHPVNVITGQN